MSGASTTTIEGWVATEPRESRTQDGHTILNVDVPVQRSKYDRNTKTSERIGETTWYQIALGDDDAKFWAEHLRAGTRIIATGVPEAHGYLKRDGSPGVSVRLLFPTLGIIPARRPQQQGHVDQQQPADDWYPADQPSDDTPF